MQQKIQHCSNSQAPRSRIIASPLLKLAWNYRAIYLMLIPAVLFYVIFCYIPMYGVTIAFKDYWYSKGILASPWIGLANFRLIFMDDKFWEVFRNTLVINLLKLAFGFPAPIILALLLNELRKYHLKRIIQTIIYLPHFISWVVISGIIVAILSNDGVVNALLVSTGGMKINFLTNIHFFRPLVVISAIWKEAGWSTILYIAALANISMELYESAVIDGANRWQQMVHITLPGIAPTISILLILSLGSLTVGGFDQIFNLYNPAVWKVGDIIDTYVYRIGLTQGEYSMGTAIGLFLNCINFILLYTSNKISKRVNGIGLY